MTKEINRKALGIGGYGQQMTMTIGIVKNNADPAHHGRLQVFVPALDNEDFKVEDLPWCWYVSPMGGVTANAKVGREQTDIHGITAYGMWSIPKNGAQVLVGCLDGNPANRFWLGCVYMPEHNRTLPAGIDGVRTEIDESGAYPQQVIPHYQQNLKEAGLWETDKHFKTRGGYERSVSHPSNKNKVKPTNNGYAPKPHEPSKADSQTHSFTTPGKHYMVYSDVDEYCRVRIKTTEGQQIIFDDTNERIYISTAKGRNWIELDETNGKVYIYSDSKVNIRAKNDINFYSDENINLVARNRVNIRSEERSVNIMAKHDVQLNSSNADIMVTASRDIHIKTTNGPRASAINEERFNELPAKGLVYRWPEKGGSSTSRIYIDGSENVDVRAGSDIKISTNSSLHLRSSLNVLIQSGLNVNIKATTQLLTQAPLISLNSGSVLGVTTFAPTTLIAMGSDTANGAKTGNVVIVTDHMVRPDHESWVRDEDEASCKTVRNKKYQG